MASNPTVVAPKSPSPVEDSAGQAQKLSVSWIFDAPSVKKNDASAPSSPCVGHSLANTRLSGLNNRPEAKIGSQPRVFILYPRAQKPMAFVSIMNTSEAAVKKLLPKSNLSRVITRDNLSAQRIFEMEQKTTEKNKKKLSHLYDHLKKKFMTDELRKLGRWRREFIHIQKFLDSLHKKMSHSHMHRSHSSNMHSSNMHSFRLHSSNIHSFRLHRSNMHSSHVHNSNMHNSNMHSSHVHSSAMHSSNMHSSDMHSSDMHSSHVHSSDMHNSNMHSSNVLEGQDMKGPEI